MKRLTVAAFCVAVVVGLASAGTVHASVTISFDPDALIQAYPSAAGANTPGGLKVDQLDARRLHQPWGTVYETFHNPVNTQLQPNSYNTYMNWRDSLGLGRALLCSIAGSWTIAGRSWGETVVIKPGTTVTGTAAAGWNLRVIEEPYGLGGASVQWWTTDSTKYINTVSTTDNFSITADLYWDRNAMVGTPATRLLLPAIPSDSGLAT